MNSQFQKQVCQLVLYFFDSRGLLVNFVDNHDWFQLVGQGFAQNKLGLRHRTFLRINNQNAAIGHVQCALNLTRKISVSWRINDIYAVIAMLHSCNFGSNGNAALTLLVATIHDQILAHFGLVVAKSLGLLQ